MIIADTSIWIDFFRKIDPVYTEMKNLLGEGKVIGTEEIFGELAQGCKADKELRLVLLYWKAIPKPRKTVSWIDTGVISRQNKLISKGVGLIDAKITLTAQANDLMLWSSDKKMNSILTNKEKYILSRYAR